MLRTGLGQCKFAILLGLCLSANAATAKALPALDCVVNPYQLVDLASSVPGVLHELHVDKSDYLEAGQIAATLEAGVEVASVALAKARAEIDSEVQVSKPLSSFLCTLTLAACNGVLNKQAKIKQR